MFKPRYSSTHLAPVVLVALLTTGAVTMASSSSPASPVMPFAEEAPVQTTLPVPTLPPPVPPSPPVPSPSGPTVPNPPPRIGN